MVDLLGAFALMPPSVSWAVAILTQFLNSQDCSGRQHGRLGKPFPPFIFLNVDGHDFKNSEFLFVFDVFHKVLEPGCAVPFCGAMDLDLMLGQPLRARVERRSRI